MRTTLKNLALLFGILLTLLIVREAFFSLTAYFVLAPGAKLYVDGRPASGWLHKHHSGSEVILTLNNGGKRESYWIVMRSKKGSYLGSCGDWTTSRSPL